MNHILITCSLLATIFGKATAQVTKTDFMNKVTYYANTKSNDKATAMGQLNNMMYPK